MLSSAALLSAATDIETPEKEPTVIHQARFTVAYDFPVAFTSHALEPSNLLLLKTLCRKEPDKRHRVLVLIDENVATYSPLLAEQWLTYADTHSESIISAGTPVIVPGGEGAKDSTALQERLSEYIEVNNIDRHSFVLAIGGGAMLDAVGLAAATAHRGVRLIRMPTTVLAQNDAGIGVKNGINRFGQKNWYGTFAPPFAVINDDRFLATLGPVERRAGMAEAVKVALIRDEAFFDWIEAHCHELACFDSQAVRYLIERCSELHLQQITQGGDPFETGEARPLDFGHWAAHRLEKMTQHRISHGDAVALGIALDSRYARMSGLLGTSAFNRILAVLQALGFPAYDSAMEKIDSRGRRLLFTGLDDFQRHLGGQLTITLLRNIGEGVEVNTIHSDLLELAVQDMQAAAESCD